MNDAQIADKVKGGWIRAIVTFEVVGKPKEHVEKSLDRYVENLKGDDRIEVLEDDREEALEHEDGMWSTFSETELLVQNLETFTWLCINFSPASIEILEPNSLSYEDRDLTNWLNDLLAAIHDVSTNYRNQQAANEHLVVAMNQLIKNSVLLSIKAGEKTEAEIRKETGIQGEQLGTFLEELVKSNTIKKRGKKYAV